VAGVTGKDVAISVEIVEMIGVATSGAGVEFKECSSGSTRIAQKSAGQTWSSKYRPSEAEWPSSNPYKLPQQEWGNYLYKECQQAQ
jgi:hypothetical protein